jgi:dihydropteroate synthase/2-amino-4-hydroxy-6-hydroxymethyldihydropteridine diphosphokinase
MYVTDQPAFLNGAVELATHLPPLALLDECKAVEEALGRNLQGGLRNGPRLVDLDILFYERKQEEPNEYVPQRLASERLTIPHPRLQERDFVLKPLLEVAGPSFIHPILNSTIQELWDRLLGGTADDDDDSDSDSTAVRVLPLPRNRFLYWNETLVMGILNVTPDSFSDGGQWNDSVEVAAQRALAMVREEGATVIDIGGESTRPDAEEVSLAQELARTIPVIQRIRELAHDMVLSIDTRRAAVARAAIQAGADLVNDVSGGSFDPDMLATVAELGVPMILMHMRGTPQTMQSLVDYNESVVEEVGQALAVASEAAAAAGIPQWIQILDPGIGFAKDTTGNLQLLQNLARLRAITGHLPLLLGTSRKGFLGRLTGVEVAADRDYASVASCVAALCLEGVESSSGTMLRVHNPAATTQAVQVMDAIRKS